ncbi:MAG: DNA replication and repair protein RecF, partial [Cyanobacteriota bacterium]|nr:DNA replication and repair protein RecF [Cyanobacteriota bacterium]
PRWAGPAAQHPGRPTREELYPHPPREHARLGSCRVGPHRDEVELVLNGTAARRFGSAGQQRTIVLALKLAELELVGELCGHPPLLLLDDVLAELDPRRQLALLEAVGDTHQCLVSATHLDAFEGGWRQHSQILKADHLRNGMRKS